MSLIKRFPPIFALILLFACCASTPALDPSLNIAQYAHTAWTFRDGFSVGNIFAIAQTTDGYLWLGGEFGLFRFDGVRAVPWQPTGWQQLPDRFVFRLIAPRDGTLWIGTFSGLLTWDGVRLIRHPEFDGRQVESMLQDHEGMVWAATRSNGSSYTRLCAMRGGSSQCFGEDGALGKFVSSLYEDPSSALWVCADSGLWRWRPGPPKRVSIEPREISGLTETEGGRTLLAKYGGGLAQLGGDTLRAYPIPGPMGFERPLADRELDANKLLRDRHGGLWIGTVEHGLIHVYHGRTDVFTKSDGLSGDIVLSVFEDREGNVWVSTTGGLDRFREFPVVTLSAKQGLVSDAVATVLADRDGSVWVGTHEGLTKWNNGQTTNFRKRNGLPDDHVESLFHDDGGRLWVFAGHELAYFHANRFIALPHTLPNEDVHSITGDHQENLWLAGNKGLYHLQGRRFVETLSWPALGHSERAKVLVADRGGVWLSFWNEGAVSYFKDGRIRDSYTAAEGLGKGRIADLQLDADGALWAATDAGGLSRIKNGHIATLTSTNGLPCDIIHWSIEDNDRSVWLYTACGLVHIARSELDAWIANPRHRVVSTVLDATEGAKLRAVSASSYSPTVARSTDGRLWFVPGEGVQVVDPHHLVPNQLPPPVRIEQVKADGKPYQLKQGVHLPANVRDVWIDYTALSLVAPEKVHFKYMLQGQDPDWQEVINDRQVQYSNLRPRKYRFRVKACNNSGVWNETGDSLEFSIDQAFYQTDWFRAFCAAVVLGLMWMAYQLRVRRLQREYHMRLEGRVEERTRIARELHDTLLQSVQGLMFSFQAALNLLPGRTEEAIRTLEEAIREGDEAIAEGRHAIQGLRADPASPSNLEHLLSAVGKELAGSSAAEGQAPSFRVIVEGARQPLSPLLQNEVHRIAREILRNAFHHAHASRIEAEITYGQLFRLRIRDDGKGIDPKVLEQGARPGHWGLPGVRERAKRIGARLRLWSEPSAGTEAELTVPGRIAYSKPSSQGWWGKLRRETPASRTRNG